MPPHPAVQVKRRDHAAGHSHGKGDPTNGSRRIPQTVECKNTEEDKRNREHGHANGFRHFRRPNLTTKIEQLIPQRHRNLQLVLRLNPAHCVLRTEKVSRGLSCCLSMPWPLPESRNSNDECRRETPSSKLETLSSLVIGI